MRNGTEFRKNRSLIAKRPSGCYDVYYIKDKVGYVKTGGSPWDYLANARHDADKER